MTPEELSIAAAKALDAKKGENIKILKISDLTTIGDYFVIAGGSSSTQIRALSGEVEYSLSQQGIRPLRTEGEETSGWVLLDYGSVIVHIFSESAREFYSLERLWADALPVPFSIE